MNFKTITFATTLALSGCYATAGTPAPAAAPAEAQAAPAAAPQANYVGAATTTDSGSGLIIGGSSANFGVRTLSPGFLPDPTSIAVVSGGGLDARGLNLGAGCVGWVTRQPDFILHLTGTSSNFRIYATSEYGDDVTLVVNAANGSWVCNDDSYGGRNPTVDLPGATPGQYDVWVGSYQQGVQARATVSFTEMSGNHP